MVLKWKECVSSTSALGSVVTLLCEGLEISLCLSYIVDMSLYKDLFVEHLKYIVEEREGEKEFGPPFMDTIHGDLEFPLYIKTGSSYIDVAQLWLNKKVKPLRKCARYLKYYWTNNGKNAGIGASHGSH